MEVWQRPRSISCRCRQASRPDLAITSPAPGSSLRVTPVTFKWNGAGDEFWLDIGSSPGASDFYASGSLGSQTEHTVSRMPLNGGALYVQLRRRRGAVIDAVSVQYTAPIRKGLAVITDFSDRRLEDWTGSGMKSVEDVSAMVGKMADHWAWLSRGRERIQWDIIRVQVPAALSPDPFQGHWVNFRNAIANLIKQQVATADYDVDVDGEIDAAWIIVSNGNTEIPSAIGGSSLNNGVNMFVDGQSSVSVVAGAIGNFNHELAHLLGIPDLYGPYDTIHTLTLMSYSVAGPASGLHRMGADTARLARPTGRDADDPRGVATLGARGAGRREGPRPLASVGVLPDRVPAPP